MSNSKSRKVARGLGVLLAALGALALVWSLVAWRFGDPLTGLYTEHEQHVLAGRYAQRAHAYRPARLGGSVAAERREIARESRAYQRSLHTGDPVGRIDVPRLGLDAIVLDGTSASQLDKGPGWYTGSFLPGQGQLIYIAGHRTTFSAPFSQIQSLRRGDRVTLELPYATFVYRVRWHVIVPATAVGRLLSHNRELVALQSCHPRFSASHRYIVYAVPTRVVPREGRAYAVS